MKIGILTQPLQNNYGGLLQNYALQQTLIRLRHEPETIDHGIANGARFSKLSMIICIFLHALRPSKYKLPEYQLTKREHDLIQKNTQRFVDKYIYRTQIIKSKYGFKKIAAKKIFDAYIVGSDQCWRPIYNGTFQEEMFLNFAINQKKIKRIAYAASFGTDKWEMTESQTARCSLLANRFDLITVREVSAVELCEKYLGVKAIHVLDPTMLLDKEDYYNLVYDENEKESKGDLFHYILDPSDEKKLLIQRVSRILGMTPFTIMPKYQASNRTRSDIKCHIQDCVFPSVTSWLRGFVDAKLVIVDSFHGAVFSIIFNKPFWVIKNGKRGNTRFESLLSMFKLNDRIVDINNFSNIEWGMSIDWESVNGILKKERTRSLEILNKGLSD